MIWSEILLVSLDFTHQCIDGVLRVWGSANSCFSVPGWYLLGPTYPEGELAKILTIVSQQIQANLSVEIGYPKRRCILFPLDKCIWPWRKGKEILWKPVVWRKGIWFTSKGSVKTFKHLGVTYILQLYLTEVQLSVLGSRKVFYI